MTDHPLDGIQGLISARLDWPEDIPAKPQDEGSITFQVADADNIYDAPAFFNPVMVLNRDLAILMAKIYATKMNVQLRIFEPLAGIGVRAFRLLKQIPESIQEVVISDFNSVTTAIANVNKYQLHVEDKLFQFKREAKSLALDLSEHRLQYHMVDLDPFGSPAPFIDAMWPLLSHRAMIAVTATDMTALCGVYPDACLRKYGGFPVNNHHCHETATRLMIAMVAKSAARFEKGVIPVLSTNVDHYTKVFFTVKSGRGVANTAVNQIGFSYTCSGCHQIYYTTLLDNKPICCGPLTKAGPLWTGPLFNRDWAELALSTLENLDLPSHKRIIKLLSEARDTNNILGFYQVSRLCKSLKLPQPSFADLFAAVEAEGYAIVRSQFTEQAFRSDIPGRKLINLIRHLVGDTK